MQSESIGQLAAALAKAQATIGHAVKDSKNPHFKSSYADLASVMDACRGALSANGIAVLQPVAVAGKVVTVTTTLAHASGEWMSCDLSATARADGPQEVGSVITYLRRYGLASMAGVASDDDDANAASRPVREERREEPARRDEPKAAVPSFSIADLDRWRESKGREPIAKLDDEKRGMFRAWLADNHEQVSAWLAANPIDREPGMEG